jgi:3-hydroxyacyl-CoA dehydrogenase/3a,7a,12a-trihydroxy-5b-cholest-24-enoyl-CoA hydratase
MTHDLRFDDKVVIITGAGQGLGKSHAHLFASRGAKVLVNDLGGSAFGDGKSNRVADQVVAEIKEAGGEAAPSYDSVEDGDKIVQAALDHFGRVDIVINNAGILRDTTFHKMTDDDWDLIYRVHVKGSYKVTHAAWPHLREQGYGRVIFTTSAAGIYGNFGQANYAMAKLGLVGLSNTLALEGAKRNIQVNAVAPVAGSRLTETVLPPDLLDALKPEAVSPFVAWLCHDSCNENGGLFEVGGGFMSKLRWERTEGRMFRVGRTIKPETVRDAWEDVTDFEATTHPHGVMDSMQPVFANVQAGPSKGGNEYIDVDVALGYEFPEVKTTYDERDAALYALGVGAAADPTNEKDLALVYELHGEGFKVLPTFGVIPAINTLLDEAKAGIIPPGQHYGFERILHGEQYTEVKRPLPAKATLTHKSKISEIFDKGKNALVTRETRSFDEDGEELLVNRFTAVVRGAGGWNGDRGPSGEKNIPPKRKPDAVIEEQIGTNQALLYRLSGDWNPLHADPMMAQAMGFEKPILHGLCTYGYAGRHVIQAFCEGDPRFFKSIQVRFADSVYPGETPITEMWKEDDQRIVFRCRVKERDKEVINQAAVELHAEIPQPKPKAKKVEGKAKAVAKGPESAAIFSAIGSYLAAHPDQVGKVGNVYHFMIDTPDSAWTLDLKNGAGGVKAGVQGKADCTLSLAESDFMDMVAGKADPQKLYFGGQLKVSGNVMASQKLEFLTKLDRATIEAAMAEADSGSEAPESADGPPRSAAIFAAIGAYVKAHPELVDKVGHAFLFQLTDPDASWSLDLKNAPGGIKAGVQGKADCTLTLSDADFMKMVEGKADPQKLYFGGQLKVSGNVMASQKLEFLTKLDPASIEAAMAEAQPAPAAVNVASTPPAQAVASQVFANLEKRLSERGRSGLNLDAVIRFVIEDGPTWTLDLKSGQPTLGEGESGDPDTTLTLPDEALAEWVRGESDPKSLFMRGALRVDGQMKLVQRLEILDGLLS